MFRVEVKQANRIDIEIDGKIDAEEMKVALIELFDKSSTIENGVMLYRIHHFDIPTMGAIKLELSKIPELFRLMGKFKKIAVLADQTWLRTVSRIEGFLLPGLEIKAFELDKESDAEAWLAE